jgi:hypothetical protein
VNVSSAGVPGSADDPVFQPSGVGRTAGGRAVSVDADGAGADVDDMGADDIERTVAAELACDPHPANSSVASVAIQRLTTTIRSA